MSVVRKKKKKKHKNYLGFDACLKIPNPIINSQELILLNRRNEYLFMLMKLDWNLI